MAPTSRQVKLISAGLPLSGEGMLASWLGVLRVGEDEVVDCTGFDFLVADPNADGEEGERADYEAVAARWPDAKVIVAYEPGDSWFRAFRAHLATLRSPTFTLATAWLPSMRRYRRLVLREVVPRGEARYGPLGAGWVDRHLEEVNERLAPERVLVWRKADGCAPLCKLLGLEDPLQGPPLVSDAVLVDEALDRWVALGWERWLYVLAGVGVILAVVEAQWHTLALLLKSPLGPHSL